MSTFGVISDLINDKEYIKNHIYLRVVPATDNAHGRHYEIPNCPSILFEACVDFGGGMLTRDVDKIVKAIFKDENVTDDDLYNLAFSNTKRDVIPKRLAWTEVGMLELDGSDIIITDGLLGPALGSIVLFTSDILKEYGHDLYIVFTSKHEAITHCGGDYMAYLDELKDTLKDINEMNDPNDFLSEHVFKFDYKKGELIEL